MTTRGWTHVIGRREIGLDVIRIYLGVALFVRGALFIGDQSALEAWFERSGWLWPMTLGHLVAAIHLGGGLLLALGLFTRFAAAVQIPSLLGAVFLIHWQEGLMQPGQSLELAGLVLVLLAILAIFGAGPWSFDARLGIRKF